MNRPHRLTVTTLACLALAGSLAACGSSESGSESGSSSDPVSSSTGSGTSSSDAQPTSTGADDDTGTTDDADDADDTGSASPSQASSGGATASSGQAVDLTEAQGVWQTAFDAIQADDPAAFQAVAAPEVYPELTEEQSGSDFTWTDWDLLGLRDTSLVEEGSTASAGVCTEGLEGDETDDLDGNPTVSCRLEVTEASGDSLNGNLPTAWFYLAQSETGEWKVVDYKRMYL